MLHEDYDDALGTFSRVLMKEPANALARINVGYICLKKRIFGEAIEHLSKAIRLDNDRKATLYAHYYLGLVYLEREMYEDAQTFFRKTLKLGPNLIEAYFELGRAQWFAGQRDEARAGLGRGPQGQQVQSRGPSAARRCSTSPRRGVRSRAVCSPSARALPVYQGSARPAVQVGQVTAVAWPRPARRRASSWPSWPAGRPSGPAWAAATPGPLRLIVVPDGRTCSTR